MQSSKNSQTLLDYAAQNRGRLDFEEFKKLLAEEKNLNAKDKDGNTALHLFVMDGGTFKYAELLLRAGADLAIANNDGQSAFDIILGQPLQMQLLFLAVSYHQLPLPENTTNAELPQIIQLINFSFPDNKYGQVIKKIIDNRGNFSALNQGDITALKYLQQKIANSGADFEEGGSGSEKEPDAQEKSDEESSNFVIENDFIRTFIISFGTMINDREEELRLMMAQRNLATMLSGLETKRPPISLPKDICDEISQYFNRQEAEESVETIKALLPKTSPKKQVSEKLNNADLEQDENNGHDL
ncbi:MAG: ankyrin repeat domain-containing protein [Pseudomonadota bacterium]